MIAYSYNRETMEYIGPVSCQLNPVLSKREGRDVFLRPGDSTWTPPPKYDTETQRALYDFISDSWTVEDIPAGPEPPTQEPEKTYSVEDMIAALLN